MKIETKKLNIFDIAGYVFLALVLYFFLVILNIIPDAFGIKELINKIEYLMYSILFLNNLRYNKSEVLL